jgi:hypothetical protein
MFPELEKLAIAWKISLILYDPASPPTKSRHQAPQIPPSQYVNLSAIFSLQYLSDPYILTPFKTAS